jgi:hypothetical protein
MGKRIIICGGRDFADREWLYSSLDAIHERRGVAAVIHGAARGADKLSAEWAQDRRVQAEPYPADWHNDGKAAGPKRNQRMLDMAAPDGVVAFPGGRGTADMVSRAQRAGVPVLDLRDKLEADIERSS